MKSNYFKILIFILVAVFLILGSVAAQDGGAGSPSGGTGSPGGGTGENEKIQSPSGDSKDCNPGNVTGSSIYLCNPIGTQSPEPIDVLNKISKVIIFAIGSFSFLFLVIGGFYWIFSGGNEEKVKKGKDIIMWTVVGLIITFSAYVILSFVFQILGISGE